ncbi:NAD(P)-dependent oxidoreductase [Solimonas sp. SE-A11]|uniref:NAD-dependent epimerase/dehydratase family protein n=1 Tax=Solimonas sp. SE-A11 TaxID=3054954 RepID=UPI00259C7CF9|nr:NAD-dependent epimerase/dehydratase family protein [Solimonas sp. SE-A11]MDM4769518.1 NAD-dependent epimerase/dehydratase family protein [Solimonas sp. SE-A11]
MTTIAITGIGGFIGLCMAQRAKALGWQVRGLDVSPAAAQRAREQGAEVFIGDINDALLLQRCFSGADIVFHTAAIVEEDGARELYERVNVEGTRSVCHAAQAQGVRQLVQLSSVMVYGFDYPDGVTEEGPFRDDGNIYNETKLRSERVALEFHRPDAFDVIVIRPGDVYGAGSVPWVLRPLQLLRQRLFTLPDGGQGVINHVHVDNLLDGVFLALDKNAGGECFTISDGVATPCSEFFGHHARMLGRGSVPTAPGGLLIALVGTLAWLYRLAGRKPPASAAGIHFLRRRGAYSIDKARRVLGYAPRVTLEEGMRGVATQLRLPKP